MGKKKKVNAGLGITQILKHGQDHDTAAAAPACAELSWKAAHNLTGGDPLPRSPCLPRGLFMFCWSMLRLALFPLTIASERARTDTHSQRLSQLAVGARRRGEAARWAAELRAQPNPTNPNGLLNKGRHPDLLAFNCICFFSRLFCQEEFFFFCILSCRVEKKLKMRRDHVVCFVSDRAPLLFLHRYLHLSLLRMWLQFENFFSSSRGVVVDKAGTGELFMLPCMEWSRRMTAGVTWCSTWTQIAVLASFDTAASFYDRHFAYSDLHDAYLAFLEPLHSDYVLKIKETSHKTEV